MQNVDFSAWGYGIWKDRYESFAHKMSHKYFISKVFNPYYIYVMTKQGLNRLRDFVSLTNRSKRISLNDNTLSVYMALEHMDVVMPVITKVRNEGWDGTGQNCSTADSDLVHIHSARMIDENEHFDFVGDGYAYYNENKKQFRTQSYARMSFYQFVKSFIR